MSKRNGKRNGRRGKDNDEENVVLTRRKETVLRYKDFVIPDHYFTHLRYVERSLLLLNTTTSINVGFAGNDCFAPNIFGGGHQPMGFDQLGALYKRFRVHSSLIRIQPVSFTQGFQVSCTPSQSASTPATNAIAMELPYTKYAVWYAGIGYMAMLENDISTREIVGIKSIDEDDQFAGTTSASPARLWYWIINVESFDGTTSAVVRCNIEIEYYVEMFDRVILPPS